MGHLLIYKFEEKRKELTQTTHKDPTELTEVDISHHTVMLRGISRDTAHSEVKEQLTEIFHDLLGDVLINVHVLGDYDHLLSLE